MLLTQDVLRLVTVMALRERTWVANRVYDSPATPADLKIGEERLPFIAVYTDDADMELDGTSMVLADSTVHLAIEIAVSGDIQAPAHEAGSDVPGPVAVTAIAQTDEALELVIGLLSRQVSAALVANDSPWAELWRMMTFERRRATVRRGGPGANRENPPAIRFATKVIVIDLSVISDPVWTDPIEPGTFWDKFFAQCAATPEMADVGNLIRSHIVADPAQPYWLREQSRGTLTLAGIRGLGISPLAQVMGDRAEPPLSHTVTMTGEAPGMDGGPPYDIDEGEQDVP